MVDGGWCIDVDALMWLAFLCNM